MARNKVDTGFSERSLRLSSCLSLDLEVGVRDTRIHALAGVRSDTGQSLTFSNSTSLTEALAKLDGLAEGADFLLGHNLIDFDLPHLKAANPRLRLLQLPAVDTLRLNPLAFPRNPYHHLVKHYQDGGIRRGRINDPELDARLALEVFDEQKKALQDSPFDLLTAWHWLTTSDGGEGFDRVFSSLRNARRPLDAEASDAIHTRLADNSCQTCAQEVIADAARHGWALAYALAWLSVSGGSSVMPPWVRHQFPEAGRLVKRLRDTACTDPACGWCRERHDARRELTRWFGFPDFRPEPSDENGQPMQRSIVEAVMAREHVLSILPTGAGKSLCYQIPALSRYDKTGALTVVISPLVALMADQVAGLEAKGIGSCVTINGLLSMPERADALDRVRLGDAGIVIVAPEQLRSVSFRRALDQREIGGWVLDEAHCLRVRLDFRGATITSDAGLLACRELDAALGLTETANDYIHESRTGRNVQHRLLPLLRQSVYSRLAGYEDTNDAERLAQDPAMRVIVGWQGTDKQAASTNTMSRFETEVLTEEENLDGLARLNVEWVATAMAHTSHQRVIPSTCSGQA